jgi:hypothetical protein
MHLSSVLFKREKRVYLVSESLSTVHSKVSTTIVISSTTKIATLISSSIASSGYILRRYLVPVTRLVTLLITFHLSLI